MITRKELGYVNLWASRVPYPGREYCELSVEKLKKCFELYNEEYADKKYTISFSNNEEIELQILKMNICHMLGIDFKNLIGDYFSDFRRKILDYDPKAIISSSDLLNLLLENIDKVLDYDEGVRARALNYYKVGIKCDIFSKLSDLSQFNYGCINFNKDEFMKNNPTMKFSSNSQKFLYTSSDEMISPYFMMGLKRSDNGDDTLASDEDTGLISTNNYIVETLIAPENIKGLFDNQEVVIPTQILTDDNGTLAKKVATSEDKIKLLRDYQAIINLYRLNNRINIYGDYLSLLMNEDRQRVRKL